VPNRGDVALVPFPFADRLARKTRPVVVMSTDVFSSSTGWCLVGMITSRRHDSEFDTRLEDWEAAHLLHPSWARTKLATIDARTIRLVVGRLSDRDMARVASALGRALGMRRG
jgi:mRNA interferase MazF